MGEGMIYLIGIGAACALIWALWRILVALDDHEADRIEREKWWGDR